MSETSVQTAPSAAIPALSPATPSVAKARPKWTVARVLKLGASLQLTVILFVLSLMLVFFGTLAQIDNGIWTVVGEYFRSAFVWVPWQLLVKFCQVFFGLSKDFTIPGSFPFFGGWLLGAALLVNLVAAHLVRFKLSWKRAGILAIHSGLIVLMLGELGTGLFAVEQRMTIGTNERVDFTDVSNRVELALLTPDPQAKKKNLVVVIPDRLLRKVGKITDPALPVDVEVVEFWKNSVTLDVGARPTGAPNERKALNGMYYGVANEKEGSGVDTDAKEDMPAVKVALYEKGTDKKIAEFFEALGFYENYARRSLIEFAPHQFKVDGVPYTLEFRPKREYKPYALTLKKFSFDRYQGTETAKNFSSQVNLETASGERRDFKISMNNPLFHSGETFYQSSFFSDENGTVLQVVRNPVWFLPYLSCALVTLGMVAHFGMNLFGFLKRRSLS